MAITTEYKGHKINVQADGSFEVDAYGRAFGSEKDARAWLDQHVAEEAKKSLPLMDLIKGTHSDVLRAARLSKASKSGDRSKEGSRGGHVIGHTSSGRAIYAPKADPTHGAAGRGGNTHIGRIHASRQSHAGWTRADHLDAASAHSGAQRKHERRSIAAERGSAEADHAHAHDAAHEGAADWHRGQAKLMGMERLKAKAAKHKAPAMAVPEDDEDVIEMAGEWDAWEKIEEKYKDIASERDDIDGKMAAIEDEWDPSDGDYHDDHEYHELTAQKNNLESLLEERQAEEEKLVAEARKKILGAAKPKPKRSSKRSSKRLPSGAYEVTAGGVDYRVEKVHNGEEWVWQTTLSGDDDWSSSHGTKKDALAEIDMLADMAKKSMGDNNDLEKGDDMSAVNVLRKAIVAHDEVFGGESQPRTDLAKGGGEGSRGGEVIGHTASGKPVYKHNNAMQNKYMRMKDAQEAPHPRHRVQAGKHAGDWQKMAIKHINGKHGDFSPQDHADAADLYRKEARKPQTGRHKTHKRWKSHHLEQMAHIHGLAGDGHAAFQRSMGDEPDLVKSGGPFIGKRGGKWADAKHTIPWKEGKHGGKAAPASEDHDEHGARELALHIDNTQHLANETVHHRGTWGGAGTKQTTQRGSIHANLLKKIANGKYDHAQAGKLFAHLAESASKDYGNTHGHPAGGGHHFDAKTRRAVGRQMADEFHDNVQDGHHDDHEAIS